ncbi:conserved hypothetical protein [Trichinella spiralis]|uniref:hypothetical protein n=1 Tax=Trichinella spiralis TaxID=6334 RepID=UPI0001EFC4B4|nr:conserved hypothetical protein [Trichinella spiralis]
MGNNQRILSANDPKTEDIHWLNSNQLAELQMNITVIALVLTTLCVIVVHSEPNLYDWYQNSGSLERFLQELREKRKRSRISKYSQNQESIRHRGNVLSSTVHLERLPSIGLSLAEYMADPERSQDFHFLRGRKKRMIQFFNS